ncbi:tyrosine-type recombinase/integrase [Leeia sp. TBRC 13508]|uniref:Tyrosine-type recombinase/integrase n=1 Tax=Leeia speluncae TaxID=2884804 RepID=A0ABS8DAA2_9NEIS|nr:tyrosine-type recombinase/integrase [Leeia speluncae]MCB6185135.1 tyrosine-type recombinase/integrase [Leeia speluncae]
MHDLTHTFSNGSSSDVVLPDHLSGKYGSMRINDPLVAEYYPDDATIVFEFLASLTSPHTKRSYVKEIIRFWKYCLKALQLPLSSITPDEIKSYIDFLNNPDPSIFGFTYEEIEKLPHRPPAGCHPLSDSWWPFRNGVLRKKSSSLLDESTSENFSHYQGLSRSSVALTINILSSLFSYMVQKQYLRLNPVQKGVLKLYKSKFGTETTTRYLDSELIKLIFEILDQRPTLSVDDKKKWARDRLVFYFYYFTGIRRTEGTSKAALKDPVSSALQESVSASYPTMGDFHFEYDVSTGVERCYLKILGKGSKTRIIPIADKLLDVIKEYRLSKNLVPRPEPTETYPIIMKLNSYDEINGETVSRILKDIFLSVAAEIKDRLVRFNLSEDERILLKDWILKLESASPHWLRHSRGSALHSSPSVSLKVLADFLGHANIATTNIYLHEEKAKSFDAINDAS